VAAHDEDAEADVDDDDEDVEAPAVVEVDGVERISFEHTHPFK
jgi:hypothetical protein